MNYENNFPIEELTTINELVAGRGFEPLTFRVAVLSINQWVTRYVFNYPIPITFGEVTQIFQ